MGAEERRRDLAVANRILAKAGLFPFSFGHMSARVGDGERSSMLIVRALDAERPEMAEVGSQDVIALDLAGNPLEGKPGPGERFLHTAIYRRRQDVGSVVHYHSTLTAAFGAAGREIVPRSALSASLALSMRSHTFGGLIDSPERGNELAETIGEGAGAFLPGHGAVVVGRDIREALARVFAVEEQCRVDFVMRLLGASEPVYGSGETMPDSNVADAICLHLWRTIGADDEH